MLTLFKPWRHGQDLQTTDQSWDEAFTNYKFTSHQSELMKFFNIHYECNDVRDDYSKILKQKNSIGGAFPYWFSSDNFDNLDDDNYDDGVDFMMHKGYKSD
jgi:hypothetical protein